jgi:uncharacterized protein YjiS (DUF1127 family)
VSSNLNVLARVRSTFWRHWSVIKCYWRNRTISRGELLQLSDHDLWDIGMTRGAARFEASKPFWRKPTWDFFQNDLSNDVQRADRGPTTGQSACELRALQNTDRRPNVGRTMVGPFGNGLALILKQFLTLSWLLPGKAAAHFRHLRCERRAMAPQRRRQQNTLDSIYETMLDRLGNCKSESSWWRRIILTAEGDYILPYRKFDPHFLRIPSVRDWLSDCYVRGDLKVLATDRLLANGIDTGPVRERLACAYSRYTSNEPMLAAASIDTVVFGLLAGALSMLSPSERIIVELMRQTNQRINTTSAEIHGALSRIEELLTPRVLQSEKMNERAPVDPSELARIHVQH